MCITVSAAALQKEYIIYVAPFTCQKTTSCFKIQTKIKNKVIKTEYIKDQTFSQYPPQVLIPMIVVYALLLTGHHSIHPD